MKRQGLTRLVCSAVEAPAAPGRALIIRWGDNKRRDGQTQIIDQENAPRLIQELNSRGVDVVIDFDHATNGENVRSDKLAPAAGWMKLNSYEAVPGEGIYARIEWTADAARMIANKQYRYLSPETWIDPKTNRVEELGLVALTNNPAIAGFPALINSNGARVAPEGTVSMTKLTTFLGLPAEATEDQIVEKCKELHTLANSNKKAHETLIKVANAAKATGGEKLASAIANADAEEIGTELVNVVNKAGTATTTGVPAERVAELAAEIDRLKASRAEDGYQALLNKHPGKIAPADEAWFKPIYNANPKQAETILNGMPKKVGDDTSAAGTVKAPSDRKALINNARAKRSADLAAGKNLIGVTERAYVHGELRAAGQPGITDEEAKELALVG